MENNLKYLVTYLGYPADKEHYGGFSEEINEVFNTQTKELSFESDEQAIEFCKNQEGMVDGGFAIHRVGTIIRQTEVYRLSGFTSLQPIGRRSLKRLEDNY